MGTECIDTRKLKTIVSVSSFLQVAFRRKELVAAESDPNLVCICAKKVPRRERASDSWEYRKTHLFFLARRKEIEEEEEREKSL